MTFLSNNGMVAYIMAAGADLVSGEMPLEAASQIYKEGTKRASTIFPGYPICVNDTYYFAGNASTKTGKKKKPCEDTDS